MAYIGLTTRPKEASIASANRDATDSSQSMSVMLEDDLRESLSLLAESIVQLAASKYDL